MPLHEEYSDEDIHTPIRWTFADSSARGDATDPLTGKDYDATDLYKFALQLDDLTVWMLVNTTPQWEEITGTGVVTGYDGTTNERVEWSASTDTDTLATGELKSIYGFSGTNGGTLTISSVQVALATAADPWVFLVKDEGGNAGANNILIDPGTLTIDGSASPVTISVDHGVARFYCDGSAIYTT